MTSHYFGKFFLKSKHPQITLFVIIVLFLLFLLLFFFFLKGTKEGYLFYFVELKRKGVKFFDSPPKSQKLTYNCSEFNGKKRGIWMKKKKVHH